MDDQTTPPTPATEGHGESVTDDEGNKTINITVTASDPEVQALEAVLVILQMMPYTSQARIVRYAAERFGIDS